VHGVRTLAECYRNSVATAKTIKRLYPQLPDEMVANIVTTICNDRASPYEFPGTRSNLQLRVSNIQQLAKKLKVSIPDNLVFGSLEVAGVNAEVEVETDTGTPLMMVNTLFLEFANELVKIAAQAVTKQDRDWVRVSRDQDLIRRRFEQDPAQRKRLSDLIDYFYGKGRDIYKSPDVFSARMQIAYTDGIESFAIAHEVGHLIHHDPASSLNFSDLQAAVRGLFHLGQATSLTRIRELNADCFALSLISEMRSEGLIEGDLEKVPSFTPSRILFYLSPHT
jgi:hypothetical protein